MADSRDEAFEELLRRVAETPHVVGAPRPIEVGSNLANRFEVLGKLGAGGMGRVFVAFDRVRQTRVAAKVLGRLTPDSIAQIKTEFRAAEAIVNENLVRLHQLFSEGDQWFFTMDLVDGVTLPELLRQRPEGRRSPELLRDVFRQLALALHTLHSVPGAPVLHRDLKPSNFLVTTSSSRLLVTLLDFGLATSPDPERSSDSAGTPVYMAPEQALGEALTEAADWYAFGVVLYEALTGRLPFGRPVPELVADAPAGLGSLCLRLLARQPAERPRGVDVLRLLGAPSGEQSSSFAPDVTALVGRQRELAVLDAALERTLTGGPGLVSIHGPSGIGKTALMDHFVRAARRRGALVLTGRCRERESMGYKAVDGLIDSIIGFLDGLPEHEAMALLPPDVAALTILFPALRAARAVGRMPRKKMNVPDRGVQRRQAIAAFCDMLLRFRRRGPVVVWIDDLQWSDRESALLLGPMLGAPDAAPVLFVGTHRSEAGMSGPLLEALSADGTWALPAVEELPLGPLEDSLAARLALALLPPGSEDAAVTARGIVREAGGHPLFIAELAHSARRLERPTGAQSPSTLSDLVGKRVAALPPAARELLEVAAVAGGPVARAVLRRTQGLSPAAAESAIDLLRANRLARSQGLLDEDSIDLHHDRIREIVVQHLGEGRRQLCHLHLARTLEARSDTSPNVLARHFEAGGEIASAGRYWLAAADQALRALAFGNAAELYGHALAQATLSPSDRRTVRTRRAEALAYAGRGADAADVYLGTAADCQPDESLELRRLAAEQLLLSGHLERGLGVIEQVLGAIGMPPTRSGRKALLSLVMGRLRLRARGLRHVVRPRGTLPPSVLARLDASWTIACSLGAIDFLRGAEFQNKHLLLALRAGEPHRLLRALTLEAAYAATPGRGSERRTAKLLAVADQLARASEDDAASSLLCLNRGIAAYLQGRLGEGLKHLEEAIYILARRSVGAVWEMVTAQRFVVASLFFLGSLRRLAEFVPPLLVEAEQNGNLYASMCFRSAYSTMSWLVGDRVVEARAQLERARTEWKAEGFQFSHCNLLIGETFVDFYAGEPETAWQRLERQWPLVVGAQLHRIGVLRVQLGHLRAASALLAADRLEARGERGRAGELRRASRRAAGRLARDPMARAAPLASLLEAGLDRAAGDVEGAHTQLRGAIRAFDAQGMRAFSAAARVRLGDLLGGDAGELMVEAAQAELRDEGVVNPRRMVDLLAPGFSQPRSGD